MVFFFFPKIPDKEGRDRVDRIWDYMEENDIAANPRPVHHRIPNFVQAELTAKQAGASQTGKFVGGSTFWLFFFK